jgi:hypothetical protein
MAVVSEPMVRGCVSSANAWRRREFQHRLEPLPSRQATMAIPTTQPVRQPDHARRRRSRARAELVAHPVRATVAWTNHMISTGQLSTDHRSEERRVKRLRQPDPSNGISVMPINERGQIKPRQRLKASRLVIVAVVAVSVVVVTLVATLAAGTSGGSTVVTDSGASGSNAVRFGGASAGSPFLPFGPKQLTSDVFSSPYTGGYVNAGSIDKLNTILPIARAQGARLIIKLPPDRALFQNPDGTFNIDLWKRAIDRLRPFDFAPYVADGTVIGAELINEPHDPNNWGGVPLTKAQFEECGAYAKSIWPTLPVGGGRSDYLLANAPWQHIDFGHSQYHMRKGDIHRWVATTVQQSKGAGVALLMSLDFLAGQLDNAAMTAAQLDYYYSAMVSETYSCALTGYMYNTTYLAQPDVASVMVKINNLAKAHPAPPCYVGGHVKS